MAVSWIERLLDHNDWANGLLLEVCRALDDDVLDAKAAPEAWSIRYTLAHLVEYQEHYRRLIEGPREGGVPVDAAWERLPELARTSGEGLRALLAGGSVPDTTIETSDRYLVEPWVVAVQAVNHATEHRRQVSGMLRDLGVDPPKLDGWSFGEVMDAVNQMET